MALIIEYFPGKKTIFSKPPAPAPIPPTNIGVIPDRRNIADSLVKKIPLIEWERRNEIIKKLSKDCSFIVGQILYPRNKEGLDLYGTCKVLGVCKTYHDFGDMEWPSDDIPLIIHAESMTRKNATGFVRFNCTPAYLTDKNTH